MSPGHASLGFSLVDPGFVDFDGVGVDDEGSVIEHASHERVEKVAQAALSTRVPKRYITPFQTRIRFNFLKI